MAKAIGLDISERGFKIVEAEGSAKKIKVTRVFVRDVETESEGEVALDQVVQELRATLREEKIPREPVVASLSAHDAILRTISVPFTSEDQIRKVIRFEAENHIQHYSIDDVILEHLKSCECGDSSQVLVFAAGKPSVEKRLGLLSRCGVDPVALDLDPLALYSTTCLSENLEIYRRVAVVEIGATHTSLLIIEEGKLVSMRSLRLGSSSIDHAIRRDLQITASEAEAKKLELSMAGGGAPSGDLLAPVNLTEDHVVLEEDLEVKPEIEKSPEELEADLIGRSRDDFLAKLHREITRTLVSRPSSSGRLDAILISGGGSRVPGLHGYLEENFSCTVKFFNPLDEITHDLEPEEAEELGPRILVPLGLVSKALGHDPLGTDFRQEEFRYQKRFDQIKIALASCITLVLILFCFMGAFFLNRLTAVKIPYDRLVQRSEDVYLRTKDDSFGAIEADRFEKLEKIKNRMKFQNEDLEKQLGKSKDFPPVKSAIDPLIAILDDYLAVEKNIAGTVIETVDVDEQVIKLVGWTPDASHIQSMIDRLKTSAAEHGLFVNMKPGAIKTDTKSGLFRFEKFEIFRPKE